VSALRAHRRSFRFRCRCFAVSDTAAVALLLLAIGAFVLQIARPRSGTGSGLRDERVLVPLEQCAVIS
jgi:hypothetical protein